MEPPLVPRVPLSRVLGDAWAALQGPRPPAPPHTEMCISKRPARRRERYPPGKMARQRTAASGCGSRGATPPAQPLSRPSPMLSRPQPPAFQNGDQPPPFPPAAGHVTAANPLPAQWRCRCQEPGQCKATHARGGAQARGALARDGLRVRAGRLAAQGSGQPLGVPRGARCEARRTSPRGG